MEDIKMSLSKLIRELENEFSAFNWDKLVEQKEYKNLLQAKVTAITKEKGRTAKVNFVESGTASTEGEQIYFNPMTDLILTLDTNAERNLAAKGMLAHECSHILFTDFVELVRYREELQGLLYQNDYKSFKYWNNPKCKEIQDYFKGKPNATEYFLRLMFNMDNAYEDSYVNNRIYWMFAGDVSKGLRLLNNQMNEYFNPSIEEMLNEGYLMIQTVVNATHKDAIGYGLKHTEEGCDESKLEIVEKCIEDIKPDYEKLEVESSGYKRCQLYTKIAMRLFDLFKEDIRKLKDEEINPDDAGEGLESDEQESDESKDSKSSSSKDSKSKTSKSKGKSKEKDDEKSDSDEEKTNGDSAESDEKENNSKDSDDELKDDSKDEDLSDKESNSLNEKLDEMEKSETQMPNGKTRSVDVDDMNKETLDSIVDELDAEIKDIDTLDSDIKADIKSICKDKGEIDAETEHSRKLSKEAENIREYIYKEISKPAEDFHYTLKRKKDVTSEQISIYNEVAEEYKLDRKLLVRKIDSILKDREVDTLQRGFYSGKKFVAKDVGRYDKKMFSRVFEPAGKPDVAFAVLIDESGSMGAYNNWQKAMEKAMFLHDVLNDLNIAHLVVGHTCFSDDCTLYSYVDFDAYDDKDCYRLASIDARSGNRDSAAITYCAEKLLQRPEKRKILIVISDGAPTEIGYYSTYAVRDCQICIEKYDKKGITTFGTIINDSEMNRLEEIYGDKCLDCTNSEDFAKTLINLVKRYILR